MLNLTLSATLPITIKTGLEATLEQLNIAGFEVDSNVFVRHGSQYYNWKTKSMEDSQTIFQAVVKEDGLEIYDTTLPDESGIREVKKNNPKDWRYLEKISESELTTVNLQTFSNGVTAKQFVGSKVVIIESDKGTIQEQYDKIDAWIVITGIKPALVSWSGGKSLHIVFRFSEALNKEQYETVSNLLTYLFDADYSMTRVTQVIRLAGMKRTLSNGEIVSLANIYRSDELYSYEEVLKACELKWSHGKPFSLEVFREYRKQKGKFDRGNDTSIDPEELLSMTLAEIQALGFGDKHFDKAFERGTALKIDSKFENPYVGVLKVCEAEVAVRSAEEIFSLAGYNHAFKKKGSSWLAGCNPFSDTNSSGSSFQVNTKSKGWKDLTNDTSGGWKKYLFLMWFKRDHLAGKDFIAFVKLLCEKLGIDFDTEYKRFNRKTYVAKAEAEITQLEELNFNILSSGIVYPTNPDWSSSDLGFTVLSQDEAQRLADKAGFPVLFCKVVTPKIESQIKEYLAKFKRSTLRVFTTREQLENNLAMFNFGKLAEIEGVKAKYLLKNIFELDIKSSDWKKFEVVEKTHYAIKSSRAREITLKELSQCTRVPDISFNTERVTDGLSTEFIAGQVLVIDSATGTGKTHFMGEMFRDFWAKHPERKGHYFGYRNALLASQSDRTIKLNPGKINHHIVDGEIEHGNFDFTSACHDSNHRLSIESFTGRLMMLDEVEAQYLHLLQSKTMQDNRGVELRQLVACVKHALATGGSLICSEANITDLTFEFLINVLGIDSNSIVFAKNDYVTQKFNIDLYSHKTATVAQTLGDLESGLRVCFVSDSAQECKRTIRKIYRLYPDKKVLLVCQETMCDDDVKAFMANPKQFLTDNSVDCLILSPSAESGIDISGDFFDKVAFNYFFLAPRTLSQLTCRVRANVDRYGYVKVSGSQDVSDTIFSVDALKNEYFQSKSYMDANWGRFATKDDVLEDSVYEKLARAESDPTSHEYKVFDLSAKAQVRDNVARADLRDNFVELMTKNGHTVNIVQTEENIVLKEEMKEIQTEIEVEDATLFSQTSTEGMTEEAAKKISKSVTATKEDVIKANKYFLERKFKGFGFDNTQSCFEAFITNKGELKKQVTTYFEATHVEVTMREELKNRKHQYQLGYLFIADNNVKGQKAKLISDCGILNLESLNSFSQSDEAVQNIFEFAKAHRKDFKRLLRMTISNSTPPITFVRELLKKVGLYLAKSAVIDGERQYSIDMEHPSYQVRSELVAAANLAYETNRTNGLYTEAEAVQQTLLELDFAEEAVSQSVSVDVKKPRKSPNGVIFYNLDDLGEREKKQALDCADRMLFAKDYSDVMALKAKFTLEIQTTAWNEIGKEAQTRIKGFLSQTC